MLLADLVDHVTGGRSADFLAWLRAAMAGEVESRCGAVLGGGNGSGKSLLLRAIATAYPEFTAGLVDARELEAPRSWPEVPVRVRLALVDGVTWGARHPRGLPWLAAPMPGREALLTSNAPILVDPGDSGRRWRLFSAAGPWHRGPVDVDPGEARAYFGADPFAGTLARGFCRAVGPLANVETDSTGDRFHLHALERVALGYASLPVFREGVDGAPIGYVDARALEGGTLVGRAVLPGEVADLVRAGVLFLALAGDDVQREKGAIVRFKNARAWLTRSPVGTHGPLELEAAPGVASEVPRAACE